VKAAGFGSHLRVRSTGSDFITNVDLGTAQIYPITAILQWHMTEHGTLRPYLGVGAAHIILRNINKRAGIINGVEFDDPTGLVVDGGLEMRFSDRWSLTGDARYVPIETDSRAIFEGANAAVRMQVKPLIVSFGVAYHY
jgi:outer membrane protein